MEEQEKKVRREGILYLCAVPIGNDNDISERCIRILHSAQYIAAEHPDKSLPFLERLGIPEKPVLVYSGRNQEAHGREIIYLLHSGADVALITDAGMPAVSDPGENLVRMCAEENLTVRVIPGACAFVSALAVSGLETGRFCFEGFLSRNRTHRREHLDSLKEEQRTLIFYEAPQKLPFTLNDLYAAFGDRRITLCADLTKERERIVRTTLSDACKNAEALISYQSEYVLVIEGSKQSEK